MPLTNFYQLHLNACNLNFLTNERTFLTRWHSLSLFCYLKAPLPSLFNQNSWHWIAWKSALSMKKRKNISQSLPRFRTEPQGKFYSTSNSLGGGKKFNNKSKFPSQFGSFDFTNAYEKSFKFSNFASKIENKPNQHKTNHCY